MFQYTNSNIKLQILIHIFLHTPPPPKKNKNPAYAGNSLIKTLAVGLGLEQPRVRGEKELRAEDAENA